MSSLSVSQNGHSVPSVAGPVLSSMALKISYDAIFKSLAKMESRKALVNRDLQLCSTGLKNTEEKLQKLRQKMERLQKKVDDYKNKIPPLQIDASKLEKESAELKNDLNALKTSTSTFFPEFSDPIYTEIDGFTFQAASSAISTSSAVDMDVDAPRFKRARSADLASEPIAKKRSIRAHISTKNSFELVKEIFTIGTPVYWRRQPAVIVGFADEAFELNQDNKTTVVQRGTPGLVYVPKAGDTCLVKDSKEDTRARYYFAEILEVIKTPEKSGKFGGGVKLKFKWKDFETVEIREFRILDTLLPLTPGHGLIGKLKKDEVSGKNNPDIIGAGYYLDLINCEQSLNPQSSSSTASG